MSTSRKETALNRRETRAAAQEAKAAARERAANLKKYFGDAHVVGGFYHDMWEAKVDGYLREGAYLHLVREPNNVHDKNAIEVFDGETGARKLGYIAKEEAVKLAALMDIGVAVQLRVFKHEDQPRRIQCRVYVSLLD